MKRLAILAAALALPLATLAAPAPTGAEPDDRLFVLAEDTALHARPAADAAVLARLGPERALLELRRDDGGAGAWVRVRVLESDVPEGWVRAAALAHDYRTEVMHHVVEPCVRTVLDVLGIAFPPEDEATGKRISGVAFDTYLKAWRTIRPLVEGRDRAWRFAVYKGSREGCIESARAG